MLQKLLVNGSSILVLLLSIICYLPSVSPVYAACDPNTPGGCPAGLKEIEQIFGNIISIVVQLGFTALLVMLLWAGFKYLTSGGEPKAIQSANQTATWAILGIFFLAISWLILQLIANFTGINITTFNIQSLCGVNGQFCSPNP